MPAIHHQVSIDAEPTPVFEALTTLDGLCGWWTHTTSGGTDLGDSLEFRFGDHVTTMEIETLDDQQHVEWLCTGSHPQWRGTRVAFRLIPRGEKTTLRFDHRDWQEADDFFALCSTKWATFLLSLKELVETGEGRPFPNDRAI